MNKLMNVFLFLVVLGFTATASGKPEMDEVQGLLKDLKGTDPQKAWDASQRLAEFPQHAKQIVPGLIDALKNDWGQCAGDPHLVCCSSTPSWQLLSKSSHLSLGLKQSQWVGSVLWPTVVHGSLVTSPPGLFGLIVAW